MRNKDRITEQVTKLEYARPPVVHFTADQFEINTILEDEEDITLIVGSTNDREVASYKDVQFIAATFPLNDRLIFNRTIAGYRGSLTLTEDLYDNL